MIAIDTNLLIYAHRSGLGRASRRPPGHREGQPGPSRLGDPLSLHRGVLERGDSPGEPGWRFATRQSEGVPCGAGAGGRRQGLDASRRLVGKGGKAG